jgi:hypothetical protein
MGITRLEEIFRKTDHTGLSSTEENRNDLIRKLKTVRDPRERDRILRLLSGQELPTAVPTTAPSTVPADKRVGSSEIPQEELPSPSDKIPMKGIGVLISAVMPAFFLMMGIMLALSSLAGLAKGKGIEEIVPELITPVMLMVFGILGLLKLKKKDLPKIPE